MPSLLYAGFRSSIRFDSEHGIRSLNCISLYSWNIIHKLFLVWLRKAIEFSVSRALNEDNGDVCVICLTDKNIAFYRQVLITNILWPFRFQINPQHTIPTLVDNGLALWESRAIMVYLVEQYGKNDSLYPKDAKARAVVNQRLYFDMGTLYQRFAGESNNR